MNYFDSSALLKLLFEERESAQLEHWVSEQSATPALSSEPVKIEVIRAAQRLDLCDDCPRGRPVSAVDNGDRRVELV